MCFRVFLSSRKALHLSLGLLFSVLYAWTAASSGTKIDLSLVIPLFTFSTDMIRHWGVFCSSNGLLVYLNSSQESPSFDPTILWPIVPAFQPTGYCLETPPFPCVYPLCANTAAVTFVQHPLLWPSLSTQASLLIPLCHRPHHRPPLAVRLPTFYFRFLCTSGIYMVLSPPSQRNFFDRPLPPVPNRHLLKRLTPSLEAVEPCFSLYTSVTVHASAEITT